MTARGVTLRHMSSFSCITFHKFLIEDYHQNTFQSSFFKEDWRGKVRWDSSIQNPDLWKQVNFKLSSAGDHLLAWTLCCSQHKTPSPVVLSFHFSMVWSNAGQKRWGRWDASQSHVPRHWGQKLSVPLQFSMQRSRASLLWNWLQTCRLCKEETGFLSRERTILQL